MKISDNKVYCYLIFLQFIIDPLLDTSPVTTPTSMPQTPNKIAHALPPLTGQVPLVSTPSSSELVSPTTNQIVLQSPRTPTPTPVQMQLLHPTNYPAVATLIHFAGDSMAQSQLMPMTKAHVPGQNQVVSMTTMASQQQLIQAAASQLQSSYANMSVPISAMSFPMLLPPGMTDVSQHTGSTGVPHVAMTPVPISAYSMATPLTTAASTMHTMVNSVTQPMPMVNLNAGIAMPPMQGVHQQAVPTSVLSQNRTNDESDNEDDDEDEDEEMEDEEFEHEEEETEEIEEKIKTPMEEISSTKSVSKGEVKIEKVPNQVVSCCIQPAACEVTVESIKNNSPSVSPSKVEVQVEVEVRSSECLTSGEEKILTNGESHVQLGRDLIKKQLKDFSESTPSNGVTEK